jgi:tight adherence protein C
MIVSHLVAPVGFGALLCVGAGWMMIHMAHAERLQSRIRLAQGHRIDDTPRRRRAETSQRSLMKIIGGFGSAIASSGLVPRGTILQLEETLTTSGFRATNALGMFVGAKVLLTLLMPGLTALLLQNAGWSRVSFSLALATAATVGLLAPDYIISSIRRAHLSKVEVGLPDALDMMVICAEAGLGLEPSIARVAQEIVHVHPALAQELARTSSELQMMSDSKVALTAMGVRTGLDCMIRLATTLIQTMQYGTPLSSALRMLAVEMRQDTLTRFEERAARLPVLLTMPMILFILPCVFLVVGGPAIIKVMKVMQ